MSQRNIIRVDLPSDELIDAWAFVRMIVEASVPAMNPAATGMDCIVGKRLTLSAVPGMGWITFAEQELDDADRQYLSGILHALPTLRLPITDDLAESFLAAYRARADRRAWEPVPITEVRYLAEQEKIVTLRRDAGWRHRETLQKLLNEGHLIAYAAGNVPLSELLVGSKILREDAAAYLTLCHIDYGNGIQPSSLATLAVSSISNIPGSAEDIQRALPQGLTTPEIEAVFLEIGQRELEWARVTEYGWAAPACMKPGGKGRGNAARWNPVSLATLAIGKHKFSLDSFARCFRKGEKEARYAKLVPWLDIWREQEEIHRWYKK
ncbi:hypothetical protein PQQ51_31010 [Paraburkholderia xenovorans]|uniref:hypothetical protein n=1 Tax=Paraburkholderia xenovorans TaxID=36873 RepID=UPI0038B7F586